jgi:hypothetical protein
MKLPSNTADLAEIIIAALRANGVEPDSEHTACGGKDWGHVKCWPIRANKMEYAIEWGDNGSTYWEITGDDSDLSAWLISDDFDLVDIANATDETPDALDADAETEDSPIPCRIIALSCYNNNEGRYSWVTSADVKDGSSADDVGHEFASIAEAQAWIDADESETYYLAHNEAGRPDYTIVAA